MSYMFAPRIGAYVARRPFFVRMVAIVCLLTMLLSSVASAAILNQPSVFRVDITDPLSSSTYTSLDPTIIMAQVSGINTSASVSFYDGNTLIGTDSSAPFAIVWRPAIAGVHHLTAIAKTLDGKSA